MNKIIINDKTIEFDGDKTILDLARENGFDIPVLCELKNCGNKGQCGVCLVEQEGNDRLLRSCAIKAKDGMVIKTESEKVIEARKERVAELLDEHEFKCGPCKRRENCEFLKLVIKTKARAHKPFIVADKSEYVDDRSKSIVLDRTKCVKCGRCVAACRTRTATNSIKFHRIDGVRLVGPEELKCFDDTNCLLCGQCVAACPVDALSEKSHIERVQDALNDPEKHVIVAMAPAVRTSMGELFKMGYGQDVTGKLYTALRALGFDKVFDINFGADMTIMEEATELIERIKNNGPFPMLTSCCPSWVREVENYFPELVENLSTAKSPQQIFGAASKTYYPQVADIDPKKVFTVTIMPCTSKKFEADRPEMENEGMRNIDAVLTTRELARMIKAAKIDFAKLEDSEVDPAMGEYTGAGVIFGATGGVMEAALRTAKDFMENDNLDNVDYEVVRGLAGIKEAEIEIAGNEYKLAVVSGAANVFELVKSGKINDYHFIEVMACPGGCVNGGGQPHISAEDSDKMDIREVRASVLYNQDKNLEKRKSHQNSALLKMYENYMGQPGHGRAHELLHMKYKK
ncbi:ferredoxin hydrogenase [Clostridium sp. LIBA-8841]|uniref:ferredoxin hydrogenase n=1 Tax=Clostridium sp. LIBA-8841 TaxID=2987530 RepID=UPI002AC747A4|nr:ferredoxin hydrogenase [Clostridium sp. LIBA-8841]MDZ5255002.1 ferredoxin hydrogenase [Clostridium sp. LIBA-8841]